MICIKGKTGIHSLEMLDLKRYPFLVNDGPAMTYICKAGIHYLEKVDRMGFEPTTFAGNHFLTQCECVIQTKLDDRSKDSTKRQAFLSLGYVIILLLP